MPERNQTEYTSNLDQRNDLTGPSDPERRNFPETPKHVSIDENNLLENKKARD
jgi:hypothetical protein